MHDAGFFLLTDGYWCFSTYLRQPEEGRNRVLVKGKPNQKEIKPKEQSAISLSTSRGMGFITHDEGWAGTFHTPCRARRGQGWCDNQSPTMSYSRTKYRWRSWHAGGLRWGPLGLDAGNLATLWHDGASQNGTLHGMRAGRRSGDRVGRSLGHWLGDQGARGGCVRCCALTSSGSLSESAVVRF